MPAAGRGRAAEGHGVPPAPVPLCPGAHAASGARHLQRVPGGAAAAGGQPQRVARHRSGLLPRVPQRLLGVVAGALPGFGLPQLQDTRHDCGGLSRSRRPS